MLALPGNHDWYDGLTAFLRLFTQDRMIGGWRTEQKRSYFTVQLPHRWWLVGLDSQLDTYFDDPQLRYFEETLTANLQPGDSVIVCCATPAWVKAWSGTPTLSTGWSGSSATSSPSRRVPGTNDSSRPARRPGCGSAATSTTTSATQERLEDQARPRGHRAADGDRRHRRRLPRRDPRHGHRGQAAARASRNWREGDNDATFVQQPVTYPSLEDSRAWVARLAQPWRKEWIVSRNPGVFTVFPITHFILFLVLLLIFWQGIRPPRPAAASSTSTSRRSRAKLFRFAGGLLAVVLLAFVICLLPMVRRRPPLLSIKAMVLIPSQLVTACACFVGFGLLPARHPRFPWPHG